MLKQMIYKELKLTINPFTYLFLLLAALMIIPSYPYFVSVFYFFMALQVNFNLMKEGRDMEFTSTLPVARKDIVRAKFFTVILTEVLQLIVAVPFALISSLVINKGGNPVGMDANPAFFGYILIAYSVFNVIFLTGYFKTGYKIGLPMVLGMIGMIIVYAVAELVTALIPWAHNNIDGLSGAGTPVRLAVLVLGIAVYAGTLFLAYKRSLKIFEKVDL